MENLAVLKRENLWKCFGGELVEKGDFFGVELVEKGEAFLIFFVWQTFVLGTGGQVRLLVAPHFFVLGCTGGKGDQIILKWVFISSTIPG